MAASTPPPAQGVRIAWDALPARVHAAFEEWAGCPVLNAKTQHGGFSPGVAARLLLADGRRVFVKAISSDPNPTSPPLHRREAKITQALPPSAPAPRLLWSYDEGEPGWVMLVFEDIAGTHPAQPWQADELDRVMTALVELMASLTPSPLHPPVVSTARDHFLDGICGYQILREKLADFSDRLDAWSLAHLGALCQLEEAAPQAVEGDTLLHFDVRGDNILLTPERVWFFDWPHASVGAAWVDLLAFAPSVTMQGGPKPEALLADFLRRLPDASATPERVNAAIASMAGYFTYRALLPAPPGLPTLRAFQGAQGVITRAWLAQRMGWE